MRDIYTIRTPENVSFDFELAGVSSRAFAFLLDVCIMAFLWIALAVGVAMLGFVLGGLVLALYAVAAFLIQWGYGALLEWKWSGQTPGKRIVGLRVLSRAGTRITLMQAVIRNLVRVIDLLPNVFLAGGLSALLDRDGRRLGDLAAGTVVVRQRRAPRPSAVVAQMDRYNSFIHDPAVIHATGRITPPERDAMVGLSVRREALPLAVRYSLFARLSGHLERRLGVRRPPELSDEKFVLNLTAVALGLTQDEGSAVSGGPP